jgi:YD repeat-containing protein
VRLERADSSGHDTLDQTGANSWNAGDVVTVIGAWTASELKVSFNGGPFVTVANTAAPTPGSTADIGSEDGTQTFLDGTVLWMAGGTGTLADADAATLNAFGNTAPTIGALPGSPTFAWNASGDVTTYRYNDDDQLVSQTDPAGNSYGFYYDSRGDLQATQYPNGTFSWNDYNPLGEQTDAFNRHDSGTAVSSQFTSQHQANSSTIAAPTDSSPIDDYFYTYNADGQKITQNNGGSTSYCARSRQTPQICWECPTICVGMD